MGVPISRGEKNGKAPRMALVGDHDHVYIRRNYIIQRMREFVALVYNNLTLVPFHSSAPVEVAVFSPPFLYHVHENA